MISGQIVAETRQSLINVIKSVIPRSQVHSLAFACRICEGELAQETGLEGFLASRIWDPIYGGYPEVAGLGFQITTCVDAKINELSNKFLDGLRRQRARSDKAIGSLSLDDVALLGFAEGIAIIQKANQTSEIEGLRHWVLELIDLEPKRNIWTSRLRDLAGDLLDKKGRLGSLPDWTELNSASLEIVLRDLWPERQMHHDVLAMDFYDDLLSRLIKHVNPKTQQVEELIVWLKAMDLLIEQNSKTLFPKTQIALSLLDHVKHEMDMVALKKTRISMLVGIVVWFLITLGYYNTKTNLAQNVQDVLNFFVPILSGLLVYAYYAVSQREINPKEFFNQILEKNKQRLYKRWKLDVKKLEELYNSSSDDRLTAIASNLPKDKQP